MGESPVLWSIKRTQMSTWLAFMAEPFAALALFLVWHRTFWPIRDLIGLSSVWEA